MNDYGSITIDNRNLLDDLLGLSDNNHNGIYQGPYDTNQQDYQQPFPFQQQQPFHLQQPQQPFQQQQQFHLQQQPIPQQQNSFYMQQRQQNVNGYDHLPPLIKEQHHSGIKNGQKVYLESPTFEKEEDDIYR